MRTFSTVNPGSSLESGCGDLLWIGYVVSLDCRKLAFSIFYVLLTHVYRDLFFILLVALRLLVGILLSMNPVFFCNSLNICQIVGAMVRRLASFAFALISVFFGSVFMK